MTEPDFLRSTRESYDTLAYRFAEDWRDELDHRPLDRAMLTAFAELVRDAGNGPVTDIGCGAGRMTGWLHAAGIENVEGVDLSPGMLAAARRDYPHLPFSEGDMLIAGQLKTAGFDVRACLTREPEGDEKRPQAFVLARKPA